LAANKDSATTAAKGISTKADPAIAQNAQHDRLALDQERSQARFASNSASIGSIHVVLMECKPRGGFATFIPT